MLDLSHIWIVLWFRCYNIYFVLVQNVKEICIEASRICAALQRGSWAKRSHPESNIGLILWIRISIDLDIQIIRWLQAIRKIVNIIRFACQIKIINRIWISSYNNCTIVLIRLYPIFTSVLIELYIYFSWQSCNQITVNCCWRKTESHSKILTCN